MSEILRPAAESTSDRRLTNQLMYCGQIWLVTTGVGAIAGGVVGLFAGRNALYVLAGVAAGSITATAVLWRSWDR